MAIIHVESLDMLCYITRNNTHKIKRSTFSSFRTIDNRSLLMVALWCQQYEAFVVVLDALSPRDLSHRDSNNFNIFHYACIEVKDEPLKRLLEKLGPNDPERALDVRSHSPNMTPFMMACYLGMKKHACHFLEHGIVPRNRDLLACIYGVSDHKNKGSMEIFKGLLENENCDQETVEGEDVSALAEASRCGFKGMVASLLKIKRKPVSQDDITFIMDSSNLECVRMVRLHNTEFLHKTNQQTPMQTKTRQ